VRPTLKAHNVISVSDYRPILASSTGVLLSYFVPTAAMDAGTPVHQRRRTTCKLANAASSPRSDGMVLILFPRVPVRIRVPRRDLLQGDTRFEFGLPFFCGTSALSPAFHIVTLHSMWRCPALFLVLTGLSSSSYSTPITLRDAIWNRICILVAPPCMERCVDVKDYRESTYVDWAR
jgi:hypothetical protein